MKKKKKEKDFVCPAADAREPFTNLSLLIADRVSCLTRSLFSIYSTKLTMANVLFKYYDVKFAQFGNRNTQISCLHLECLTIFFFASFIFFIVFGVLFYSV